MSDQKNFLIKNERLVVDNDGNWYINGYVRESETGKEIVLHSTDIEDFYYQELLEILNKVEELELPSDLLVLSSHHPPEIDSDSPIYDPHLISATLNQNSILFSFHALTPTSSELTANYYTERVSPLERRKNIFISNIDEILFDSYSNQSIAQISISVNPNSNLKYSEISKEISEFRTLIEATAGPCLSQESFIDIVCSGQIESILGQKENDWLEVKSRHFRIENEKGKYDFLKSVMQFANAPQGGVLLIGAKTNSSSGEDIIEKITPIQINENVKIRQKYTSILSSNSFPPIKNLRIEEVPHEDGVEMLIIIPPQPEELKPFLIHGTLIDGRTSKNHISIVERNSDTSYTYTPQSIHSMLSAGRSFLRNTDSIYFH